MKNTGSKKKWFLFQEKIKNASEDDFWDVTPCSLVQDYDGATSQKSVTFILAAIRT
jgi:hypothetical protein